MTRLHDAATGETVIGPVREFYVNTDGQPRVVIDTLRNGEILPMLHDPRDVVIFQ